MVALHRAVKLGWQIGTMAHQLFSFNIGPASYTCPKFMDPLASIASASPLMRMTRYSACWMLSRSPVSGLKSSLIAKYP